MIGSHPIRTWSKMQATIALSSAEAELFGGVKTACETLGIASLLKGLGQDLTLRMHTDASAVLGIAERRGVGKVRHLRAGTLGLQAKQSKNIMEILTAPGSENVTDIFTKNFGQWLMQKHLASMNLEYRSGRAVTAAQFHSLLKARAGDECEERDHAIKSSKAAIPASRQDQWVSHQSNRILIRRHHAPRLCMFTLWNAESGPNSSFKVGAMMTTVG